MATFTSARQALRAAVALGDVLATEASRDPDLPLNVGMGIDAGEAVAVEAGYRGAALNTAARLCSQAGAGQILVAESVTHLAGPVEGVRLGERHEFELKGLSAPLPAVEIMAAGPRPAPATSGTSRAAELPPELDPTTPLSDDRARDARRLRWWWRRPRNGAGSIGLLIGAAGIGKTRLLGEAAALAARDGAKVSYVSGRDGAAFAAAVAGAQQQNGPTLLVLDDLDAAPAAARAELLALDPAALDGRVVVIGSLADEHDPAWAPLVARAGDDVARLQPLSRQAVAAIIAAYGAASDGAPIDAILDASGGLPGRAHQLASQWARSEVSRRLADVAARAAASRTDLRALEGELADNVIDLQLVGERSLLYGQPSEARAIDGTVVSPYKGLAPFDTDDAAVFFGRERLVAEMVGRLAGTSLLGIIGPSGSGKSSTMRAGLLPALSGGVLPGSEGWTVIRLRPGADPVRALDRAAFAALAADRREASDNSSALEVLLDGLNDGGRLVVAIDQFEEVFTLSDDEAGRSRFIESLIRLSRESQGRHLVILALRADFYGRCAAYPELAELLGANQVLVGPMTPAEYRRAIVQPAVRAGLRLEPALAEALVQDVSDEPGALPLLSSALYELWQLREGRTITLNAYRQTGGVRGAVARLAEGAYDRLDDDQRPLARAILLRLAGPGEGDAVVRRRVPLIEFDAERNEQIAHVLNVLTDARLVTVSEGNVEVAHEALLREWPRLQEWLEEDREGRRLRLHLSEAAREWDTVGRDSGELYRGARLTSALDWTTEHNLELNELERGFLGASREASEREAERQRRANRRLRVLVGGIAIVLLLALAAGGFAFVQGQLAAQAASTAQANALGATAVIENRLDTSLLLARQAYDIAPSTDTKGTLLASLLKAPAAIRVLPGTGHRVLYIRGSGDGRVFLTGDNDGTIATYDAETMELLHIVPIASGQTSFDLDRTGSLAVGTGDDELLLLDPATGEVRTQPLADDHHFVSDSISFAADGSSFVSLEGVASENPDGDEPIFLVTHDHSGQQLRMDLLPFAKPNLVLLGADGKRVLIVASAEDHATGEGHDELAVLDAATMAIERTFSEAFTFDLSPDGHTLAVAGADGAVKAVDLDTGAETPFAGRHNAAVQSATFSPDGAVLVTTGDDRNVIVWDVMTHSLREILRGHAGRIAGTAFNADLSTAFTVGLDSRVIAWDLTGERRIGRATTVTTFSPQLDRDPLVLHEMLVVSSPDGSVVASATGDRHVVLADAATGAVRWDIDPWPDAQLEAARAAEPFLPDAVNDFVASLAFSSDGTMVAVGGPNVSAVVLDVATGRDVARWNASHLGWVNNVSFTADGRLVTVTDDGLAGIWDPRSGTNIRQIRIVPEPSSPETVTGFPFVAAISPDGKSLAVATSYVGDRPTKLSVVDIASGKSLWETQTDVGFGGPVSWSPDSKVVATGGRLTGNLTLRNGASGEGVGEPVVASAGFVLSVDWAWDGAAVVTSGTDGTIRLFDATTHHQIGSSINPSEHGWVFSRVLRDDRLLAMEEQRAWLWDLDPAHWAEQACSVADRQLTESEWRAFLPDRPFEPACGA